MTEQEKRAQFFAKTGRIATSELVEYQAFLWGMEYAEESLRQQVTLLRDALDQLLDDMGIDGHCVCEAAKQQAKEALAATADLENVILCHAEPVGSMTIFEKHEKLYRAWEPKP